MLKYIIYSILFLSLSTACSSHKNNQKTEPVIEKPVVVVAKNDIPKLSSNLTQMLFSECNGLDGTFYQSSKSINLWGDNVKHILTMFINEPPAKLNDNLIGHLMMLKDGNQLSFVEISMSGTDNYFIFNIDEKKYYNKMNAKGVQFFNRFLTK